MASPSFVFSLDEDAIAEYDALYDLYDDYREADFGPPCVGIRKYI